MKNQRGSVIPAVAFMFGAAVLVTILAWQFWPKDEEIASNSSLDANLVVNAGSNGNTNTVVGNTNTTSNTNTTGTTNTNSSNTNTAANPTAGWKTYTNSQLGYEVKYPSDWRISTCTGVSTVWFGTQGVICNSDAGTWDFSVTEQGASFNLDQTLSSTKSNMVDPVQTNVTVSGTSATRLRGQTKVDIGPGSNRYYDTIYVRNGSRYYSLSYSADGVIGDEIKNNFEAFLKSFAFTN